MRPLQNNEKRLAALFIFLIIGYAHLRGYEEWQATVRRNTQKEIDLVAEKNVAAILMESQSISTERLKFLSEKQPVAKEPDLASAALIDTIQKSADTYQLKITDIALQPTQSLPHAFQTSATVKLTGKFENVVQWLYQLQGPENFTTLIRSSIKSDPNPPQVIAEFEIARWYKPIVPKP
ncbi:MAG: hypothetical protein V4507_01210 [Verrucomicrobiota bacterium]